MTRIRRTLAFAIALLLAACAARAEGDAGLTLWFADNGQDAAWLAGPALTWSITETWVTRVHWIEGRYNPGGDIETADDYRVTAGHRTAFGEFGAGLASIRAETRLQAGWVWSTGTERDERNADIVGPLLYARAEPALGGTPLRFVFGAAFLPYDAGDFDDLGHDAQFLEADIGIAFETGRIRATFGYRGRWFRDLPPRFENDRAFDRNTLEGVVTDVRIRF